MIWRENREYQRVGPKIIHNVNRKDDWGCGQQPCGPMSISEADHRSEVPKIISATAPITTDAKPGRSRRGAAPVLPVLAAAALRDGDGVVSPSVLDALPRSELSISHNWRMFFTSEGKFTLTESNTAV